MSKLTLPSAETGVSKPPGDTVRIALIAGPMYDPLYESIRAAAAQADIDIDRGFHGDHPALNAHLVGADGSSYDLVSTHTKYAPSQASLLAPLDDLLRPTDLDDFVPRLLEMCRVGGKLFGLPRNVDVRLLHYRTDKISKPPSTWDELATVAREVCNPPTMWGFAFPGMESGLFGTFYELAEMAGAELFPESGRPKIENEGGRWALELLRKFVTGKSAPADLRHFHYDQVHKTFISGHAAMIGDWPGFYASYTDPSVSKVAGRFAICPYPTGPTGKSLSYGGSHTFALTQRGASNPAAVALLKILVSETAQLFEARRGSVPVRRSVMATIQSESKAQDLARWKALAEVIESHVVIPPKLACYPVIEDVIWKTVQSAVFGSMAASVALESIANRIEEILKDNREQH